MALSFKIDEARFKAENFEKKYVIKLDPKEGKITQSMLTLSAKVPGIFHEKLDELVAHAEKKTVRLLNIEIKVEATLV